MSDLSVFPATQAEYAAVLEILFQRSPAEDRKATIKRAQRLLSSGELDPRGLLVARLNGQMIGTMLAMATPGAVGLVWPPQVRRGADRTCVEDALIAATGDWLRRRGVKLAQALVPAVEADLGPALERNGFQHITKLLFQRRWLDDLSPADWVIPASLTFQSSDRARALFVTTLQRTYVGTLDCPEVDGVRTIDEVMAGYQAQEGHDPARWWLVLSGGAPVGVLLANASREEPAWEVVYLVTLSVDSRNAPALRLYRKLGFDIWDEREIFLAIFNGT
jgi:hypothetical protein